MLTDLLGSDELEQYMSESKIELDAFGVLKQKGRAITAENHEEAVVCMKKLFGALGANEDALGVAAQQVGHDLNMFVAVLKGEATLFINPSFQMIKPTKYTHEYYESCLSLPDRRFKVKRCSVIKARWQDAFKKWHESRFKDLDSIVFQHEFDHTRGILISDKGIEVNMNEGPKTSF